MRLLVSVVDAGEARAAAAAGADIVDVKNPAEGSLGAPSPAVIAAVRAAVAGRRCRSAPRSATCPTCPARRRSPRSAPRAAAPTFVKVGLWGVSTEADAVALLRAVRDGACPARWSWPRAYADARRVPHAPLAPELLPRVARAAGVGGLPARHGGQGRPRAAGLALARRARRRSWPRPTPLGLQVALAGALRAEDLPVVRATGADIAGVRSAACGDGRRSGPLDAARVRALRAALTPATPRASR